MRLRVDVEIPKVRAVVTNESELVTRATSNIARKVLSRTQRGIDSAGKAMPKGKQDHPPLRSSGQLINSIGPNIRQDKKGRTIGSVTALGNRSKEEQATIKAKTKAARAKTRVLREAFINAIARSDGLSRDEERAFSSGIIRRRREGSRVFATRVKTSRIQARSLGSKNQNAALAAILSVPPKDAKGKKGNRGVYRVFELSQDERSDLIRAAREARLEFVQVGTEKISSK